MVVDAARAAVRRLEVVSVSHKGTVIWPTAAREKVRGAEVKANGKASRCVSSRLGAPGMHQCGRLSTAVITLGMQLLHLQAQLRRTDTCHSTRRRQPKSLRQQAIFGLAAQVYARNQVLLTAR